MKKIMLFAFCLVVSGSLFAQKSKIRSAAMYLEEKDFDKALSSIEEAIANESTKDNPDAYFTQAAIYLQMMDENKVDAAAGLQKSGDALAKVMQLKPDYDPQKLNVMVSKIGGEYFNRAVSSYNARKYSLAFNDFEKSLNYYAPNGKTFFAKNPKMDTLVSDAYKYQAFSAVYDQQPAKGIPILEKLKNDPIAKSDEIYNMLIQAYEGTNNKSALLSTINEARKLYPANKNIMNAELNYYIREGKMQELVNKLEEAVAKEPSNEELLFTLGITYDNMANPHDASGKELTKPANADELNKKAAAAYDKVLTMSPNNISYLYNRATLYFNKGVELNKQMNDVTDMSAAGQKKYDALKVQRNNEFGQSLPLFEKIYNSQKGNWNAMSREDKISYQQTLLALSQIYNINDQKDKAKAVKSELDSLK